MRALVRALVCILHLVLFVLLGQGREVAGDRHDNGGGLLRGQEGEEPGDEPFPLPHGHDRHTLLVTHPAETHTHTHTQSLVFVCRVLTSVCVRAHTHTHTHT